MYRYAVQLTRAYPPDSRIFIARLLPIVLPLAPALAHINEQWIREQFDWGNRYERCEDLRLGKVGEPSVLLTRYCYGDAEFTDEWEASSIQLEGFCPPHLDATLLLEVRCAESFLLDDYGDHKCSISLQSDSQPLFLELQAAIEAIVKRFANAHIEILP